MEDHNGILRIQYKNSEKNVWIDYYPDGDSCVRWDEIVDGLLTFLDTEVQYSIDSELREDINKALDETNRNYLKRKYGGG